MLVYVYGGRGMRRDDKPDLFIFFILALVPAAILLIWLLPNRESKTALKEVFVNLILLINAD